MTLRQAKERAGKQAARRSHRAKGLGKATHTAKPVGAGLAMLGPGVEVIDADLGLRNLDVMLEPDNRIVYGLVDVIDERCHLR